MRLFVAIELDEPCKQALLSAAKALQCHTTSARIVPVHLAHLTLAFIGERPDAQAAKAALDKIEAPGFEMSLQGAGRFGLLENALVWVGVRPSHALFALQEQVISSLRAVGIPIDAKPFAPHITLARRCVLQNADQFEIFRCALPFGVLCSLQVQAISLMHSHRVQGALEYTPIAQRALSF